MCSLGSYIALPQANSCSKRNELVVCCNQLRHFRPTHRQICPAVGCLSFRSHAKAGVSPWRSSRTSGRWCFGPATRPELHKFHLTHAGMPAERPPWVSIMQGAPSFIPQGFIETEEGSFRNPRIESTQCEQMAVQPVRSSVINDPRK